ncbi:hypothetical protein BSPWISOXPB_348 [uncultured Gammaproteobacteria bacterium]|nr:hypothetical protein BSPWISOXPB_348 [uncultured Gammaproteobacteria bacterium]
MSARVWLEGLGVVLVVGLDLVGMLNRHLLLWISFVWRF